MTGMLTNDPDYRLARLAISLGVAKTATQLRLEPEDVVKILSEIQREYQGEIDLSKERMKHE